jgi:hypothetical protein
MRNLKRKWTADEDVRLRQLLEGGESVRLVAAKHQRTPSAVKTRSRLLRISASAKPELNFGIELEIGIPTKEPRWIIEID